MTTLSGLIAEGFLRELLAGMAVNFAIAAIATLLGLLFGLVLAWASLGRGPGRRLADALVGLMRAAPTFVVMFFLINAIPRDARLLGVSLAPSGMMAVALSLLPYAAAYVADNGAEALRHLRLGSPQAALLFLPGLMRAFFVMVMSSSAGAAIDVQEGVAVILRGADRLPDLGEQLVLYGIGILLFGLCLQTGFALVEAVRGMLARRVARA